MTPLDEAQALVLAACDVAAPTTVAADDALGLVLAADVVATEQVPPFANSAVDGYAVRAADVAVVPVELAVVDEVAAGAATDRVLAAGEAIRIMTGAPVPAGADAIVMVEDSERVGDDRVRLSASVEVGAAVRGAGEDVQPGDVVFRAGTVVRPAVIGVLASINATRVLVHRRPRVAVLSTGDELVTDGSPLRPGQIRESNLRMLRSLVERTGCEAVDLGVVPDDEDVLERVLRRAAAECDAIVSSGGVSMGDYDVVKAVLGRIADMDWMQIAIKPAKPFAFGTLDGVPVFGLPGNPVSSLVSFEVVARPALRKMMGYPEAMPARHLAVLDVDVRRGRDGKTHLVRVTVEPGRDGRLHVRPVVAQGSHQLAATASADALAFVSDGDGLRAGDEVEVQLLVG